MCIMFVFALSFVDQLKAKYVFEIYACVVFLVFFIWLDKKDERRNEKNNKKTFVEMNVIRNQLYRNTLCILLYAYILYAIFVCIYEIMCAFVIPNAIYRNAIHYLTVSIFGFWFILFWHLTTNTHHQKQWHNIPKVER